MHTFEVTRQICAHIWAVNIQLLAVKRMAAGRRRRMHNWKTETDRHTSANAVAATPVFFKRIATIFGFRFAIVDAGALA